jgi:uncharacterized protein (DUF1501 family)
MMRARRSTIDVGDGRSGEGGKVHGKWPALSTASLYQERDLAVTTDFRDPIATVLRTHMVFSDAQIDRVFPSRPARAATSTA